MREGEPCVYVCVVTLHCFHGDRDIMPAVRKNWEREKSQAVYDPTLFSAR